MLICLLPFTIANIYLVEYLVITGATYYGDIFGTYLIFIHYIQHDHYYKIKCFVIIMCFSICKLVQFSDRLQKVEELRNVND